MHESFMPNSPIVRSLLDLDFYKLTMGRFIFNFHPDVIVRFAFKNRTSNVNLLSEIHLDELREQLDHVLHLRLQPHEIGYLEGLSENSCMLFEDSNYIEFLRQLQFCSYDIRNADGILEIEVTGPWKVVTYWETIILSVVNELRSRKWIASLTKRERGEKFADGIDRFLGKVNFLREHPEIKFMEFGTRRRFSALWQDFLVGRMAEVLPKTQFLGTSNVFLSKRHRLRPLGTNAHELPMVYSAIYQESDKRAGWLESQRKLLFDWQDLYGHNLLVALPDTFGTKYFLDRVVTSGIARSWQGSRQDSGDPLVYGDMWIDYYQNNGIDPREKLILFSDGLDTSTMQEIAEHFAGRIQVAFGWGTNLTNDLELKPLSLVMKPVAAWVEGVKVPLVKLSDNIAKATGEPSAVDAMKRRIGYDLEFSRACTY